MAEVKPPRHLAWPLRLLRDGSLATVEQDTLADVQQCVVVLRRTPLGARVLAPKVGLPDPTFTSGVDPVDVEARLTDEENGEPRADVRVDVTPVDGRGRSRVRIRTRLAADQPDPTIDQDADPGALDPTEDVT